MSASFCSSRVFVEFFLFIEVVLLALHRTHSARLGLNRRAEVYRVLWGILVLIGKGDDLVLVGRYEVAIVI